MADALTLVVLATERPVAHLLARVFGVGIVLRHTRHVLLVFAAVAAMFHLILATLTVA